MDPLSITVATVSLAKICAVVGWELKQFIDGTELVNTAVNVLLVDVEGFGQSLELMKNTVADPKLNESMISSGHVGNHWINVRTVLRDAEKALSALSATVAKVDKKVTVMDATRKHIRMKNAAEEIGLYQQQIRSYRDTLQVSLQTAVMWQQVASHEAASDVNLTLDQLQRMIRQLAMDMNQRMTVVEGNLTSNKPKVAGVSDERDDEDGDWVADHQLEKPALDNLRNCLRSAASIVSSASTALGRDVGAGRSTVYGSDFGDVFPPQPSDLMLSWIESNRVEESSEVTHSGTAISSTLAGSMDDLPMEDDWDSEEEMDIELTKMMLKQGKAKVTTQDYEGAERYLENCKDRLVEVQDLPRFKAIVPGLLSETLSLLVIVARGRQDWNKADKLLKQKILLTSRSHGRDLSSTNDMLALAEVLLQKQELTESLLYARKTYRASKKQGAAGITICKRALALLVTICTASDKQMEAEAYGALLDDISPAEAPPAVLTPAVENARTNPAVQSSTSGGIETSTISSVNANKTDSDLTTAPTIGSQHIDLLSANMAKNLQPLVASHPRRPDNPSPELQITRSIETNPFRMSRQQLTQRTRSDEASRYNPFRATNESLQQYWKVPSETPIRPSTTPASRGSEVIEQVGLLPLTLASYLSGAPSALTQPEGASTEVEHVSAYHPDLSADRHSQWKTADPVEIDSVAFAFSERGGHVEPTDFATACQLSNGYGPRSYTFVGPNCGFSSLRDPDSFRSKDFGHLLKANVLVLGSARCGKTCFRGALTGLVYEFEREDRAAYSGIEVDVVGLANKVPAFQGPPEVQMRIFESTYYRTVGDSLRADSGSLKNTLYSRPPHAIVVCIAMDSLESIAYARQLVNGLDGDQMLRLFCVPVMIVLLKTDGRNWVRDSVCANQLAN